MPMDLPSYIRSLAPENVMRAIDVAAQRWDVPANTVKAWLYGERIPRPKTARRIVERERGRVTLSGIYGEHQ